MKLFSVYLNVGMRHFDLFQLDYFIRERSTRKFRKMLYDNTNEIIPECIKLQMNCYH